MVLRFCTAAAGKLGVERVEHVGVHPCYFVLPELGLM